MVLTPASVFAFNLDMSFSQAVTKSSNFLHIPEINKDQILEETINTSSVNVKLNEDSSEFNTTFDLNLSYLDYDSNIIGDVTRNSLKSSVLWIITPKHYSWYFEDNYTQTQTDPSKVFSEANLQNVNQFVTGPELEWEIGDSVLHLDSYLYDYDFSQTDNDNSNVVSHLTWGKKIITGMMLDLTYSTKFVSYEDPDQFDDYNQSTAGVSLKYKRNINNYDVFYGKTILNRDGVLDQRFTDAHFIFSRQLSRYSVLSINYSNKISDSSGSLDEFGTSLDSVFVDENSSISYSRSSGTFGLELLYVDQNKNDTDSSDIDQRIVQSIVLSRKMAARSQFLVSYSDTNHLVDNSVVSYEDDFYESKLEYVKRFNNKITLKVFVSDLFVKSNDVARQYVDKRAGLTFAISR